MMFYVLSVFSIAALGLTQADKLTFPATLCKRNSNDYFSCLKNAIEESYPRFVKGLPEFDFPALDPMLYPGNDYLFDNSAIHGKVSIFNTTINGLAKTRFLAVRAEYRDDKFHLEIDINIPKIFANGTYEAFGEMSGFRMAGGGNYNVTMEDLKITWNLIGPVINDTWTIKRFIMFPSIRKMRIHFNGFVKGNEELNNIIQDFVNEFWPAIYRAMLPTASKTWEEWLSHLANLLFSKVSFSNTFL